MTQLHGDELPFDAFDPGSRGKQAKLKADTSIRLWSRDKARLIAEYLRLFVAITKHGTYIDGFAGPQSHIDCWSARKVLEAQPTDPQRPRLRHFYLFDSNSTALNRLHELKTEYSAFDVEVRGGDFNERVKEILVPTMIGEKEATFCLLDQRTFECEWQTVRALANFKKGAYKVEVFYFLADRWLNRAIAGSTTGEGREKIARWWGNEDWDALKAVGVRGIDRASMLADRFKHELGYRFAVPWQVYERKDNNVVMYFMIHATDHADAPSLMARAYSVAVRPHASSQTEFAF
jgi:three-Cys-motif partner protein